MGRKLHTYEADDIVVDYDLKRCIHVAECVRGLARVFDTGRKPWVDPEQAPAQEVADVVERCPTGALHYTRRDGGTGEQPAAENSGRVAPDGPLYLRGRIRLELPGGAVLEDTRVALCRCGLSADKPFCDGSHVEAGFADAGVLGAGRLVPVEGEAAEAGQSAVSVTVSCRADGPLLVSGPLRIVGTDGAWSAGGKGALCRCGGSATKPFCDGSHRDQGFEAAGT
jgi:CDGSH-type Zn-finger protein/uncharacterized Fe-S cluster protein YjdI